MDLVTIGHYANSIDAYICKDKLESEGIECYLLDANMSDLIVPQLFGGVKLQVNEADAEEASRILEEISDDTEDETTE